MKREEARKAADVNGRQGNTSQGELWFRAAVKTWVPQWRRARRRRYGRVISPSVFRMSTEIDWTKQPREFVAFPNTEWRKHGQAGEFAGAGTDQGPGR